MKLSEAIAAIERGEEVEYKPKGHNKWFRFGFDVLDSWSIKNTLEFSFRLKPKPVEIWVNFYEQGVCYIYHSKTDAINSKTDKASREAVHFREVVGEE